MKQIFKKLRSKAGESLVESLAAILVFTFASIILYSLVTTAGDINARAKEADRLNQQDLVTVEKGVGTPGNGTVSFKLGENSIASVAVDIYTGDNGLKAYFKRGG